MTAADFLIGYIADAWMGGDAAGLRADTPIIELNIIDSAAIFDLVHAQAEFGVTVPLPEITPANFGSVGAIAAPFTRPRRRRASDDRPGTQRPGPGPQEVLEIIASNTLYDVAQLRPESHFEGELGVDAAVLEAIVGDVRDRFGRGCGCPASHHPQDLIDAVERALAAGAPATTRACPRPSWRRRCGTPTTGATSSTSTPSWRRSWASTRWCWPRSSATRPRSSGFRTLAAEITVPNLRALIGELRARTGAPEPPPDELDPEELAVGELDPVRSRADVLGRPLHARLHGRPRPRPVREGPRLPSYLRGREAEHLYWYGMPLRSRCANRARIHDELTGRTREFLMFASNNYLGLANHPRVVDAICEATRSYGATNTGCRIIGGTNHLHKELERRLAAFKRRYLHRVSRRVLRQPRRGVRPGQEP